MKNYHLVIIYLLIVIGFQTFLLSRVYDGEGSKKHIYFISFLSKDSRLANSTVYKTNNPEEITQRRFIFTDMKGVEWSVKDIKLLK